MTNTYNNRLRTALSLAQPTGKWTNSFGYDAAKRLTNVTSQAGSFAYLLPNTRPSTLVTRLSLPNSSYITNTYDSVARQSSTALKNSSHSTLNSHSYQLDPGNQRTQQVFSAGSTYNYSHDPIGQLIIADSANGSEDRGYSYDAAWNLYYRTNNGSLETFSVDGKNQLSGTPYFTPTYDNNGNLTVANYGANGFLLYSYDDENRLKQVYYEGPNEGCGGEGLTGSFSLAAQAGIELNGGEEFYPVWMSEFSYDGLGRLRTRVDWWFNCGAGQWNELGNVRYVYDGMRVIQERNEVNTPQVSYTRGNDLSGSLEGAGGIGGLLGRSHGYSSGTGNWSTHNCYHADGNGNITYLVNSSQTVAASYRYDPYGNTISSSGSLASASVYRFSSKEIHANSGLYYYGFRWYHPNLQRWLNRDPIGEYVSVNLYCFTGNAPINFLDPFGLQPTDGTETPVTTIGTNCYVASTAKRGSSGNYVSIKITGPPPRIIIPPIDTSFPQLPPPVIILPTPPPNPGNGCSTCPINNPAPIKVITR